MDFYSSGDVLFIAYNLVRKEYKAKKCSWKCIRMISPSLPCSVLYYVKHMEKVWISLFLCLATFCILQSFSSKTQLQSDSLKAAVQTTTRSDSWPQSLFKLAVRTHLGRKSLQRLEAKLCVWQFNICIYL